MFPAFCVDSGALSAGFVLASQVPHQLSLLPSPCFSETRSHCSRGSPEIHCVPRHPLPQPSKFWDYGLAGPHKANDPFNTSKSNFIFNKWENMSSKYNRVLDVPVKCSLKSEVGLCVFMFW